MPPEVLNVAIAHGTDPRDPLRDVGDPATLVFLFPQALHRCGDVLDLWTEQRHKDIVINRLKSCYNDSITNGK